MTPTRRDFIKFVVAGAVTSGCPFNLELLAQSAENARSWTAKSTPFAIRFET